MKSFKGKKLNYPFHINRVKGLKQELVLINSETQLLNLIIEELGKEENKKKQIDQIIDELGFYDTITLLNRHDEMLLNDYEFYKYNTNIYDNEIWYHLVVNMRRMERWI